MEYPELLESICLARDFVLRDLHQFCTVALPLLKHADILRHSCQFSMTSTKRDEVSALVPVLIVVTITWHCDDMLSPIGTVLIHFWHANTHMPKFHAWGGYHATSDARKERKETGKKRFACCAKQSVERNKLSWTGPD